MGAVSEQDGPRSAEVEYDALQCADRAVVEQLLDFPVHRAPAPGVVDGHGHVPALNRGDHPVGIRKGGRNRFLAIDAPDTCRHAVHDDVGVAVIRGHHAQYVGFAGFQHLPVIRESPQTWEGIRPIPEGVLQEVFFQVADTGHLRKRQEGVGRYVAVGHFMTHAVVAIDGGTSRSDAAQTHHAGPVLAIVSHGCPFCGSLKMHWKGYASFQRAICFSSRVTPSPGPSGTFAVTGPSSSGVSIISPS